MTVQTGSDAFLMNTHHSSLPALGARKAAPQGEVERANGTYGKKLHIRTQSFNAFFKQDRS